MLWPLLWGACQLTYSVPLLPHTNRLLGTKSWINNVSIKILSLPQIGELPCMKQIRDSGSFFIRRPMKNSLPKSSARMKAPYFRKPTSYGVNSTHSANTCTKVSSTIENSPVARFGISLSDVGSHKKTGLACVLSKPCQQPLLNQPSHCPQVWERTMSGLETIQILLFI